MEKRMRKTLIAVAAIATVTIVGGSLFVGGHKHNTAAYPGGTPAPECPAAVCPSAPAPSPK